MGRRESLNFAFEDRWQRVHCSSQGGQRALCRGAGRPFSACTCHHAMPSGTSRGQESVQGHSLHRRQTTKCKFTTWDCSGRWVCALPRPQPFSPVRLCAAVTARREQRLGGAGWIKAEPGISLVYPPVQNALH